MIEVVAFGHGFAPYVPAIDEAGSVSFRADDGVWVDGERVWAGDAASHPDRDPRGAVSFYTGDAVLRVAGGRVEAIARAGDRFARIGPLGPTVDDAGRVAFRADLRSGGPAIFLEDRPIAIGWRFEGLPVATAEGVVFRGEGPRGDGIWLARDGTVEPIARIGDGFTELGRFPSASRSGRIAFVGVRGGRSGVFLAGREEPLLDERDGFESLRGALAGDEGPVVAIATPVGGTLGVHAGAERLTGLGDPLLGSTVVDLALNPVSRSDRWVAIRVALADGREAILRASLSGL